MRTIKSLSIVLAMATIIFGLCGTSWAESGQKTVITFDQPVEIPGVVLVPGAYVFKSTADGRIVQVWDGAENHIYATLLTTPSYRLSVTDNTFVTFDENAKGAPAIMKTWFNPGQTVGQEFVK